MDDLQKKSRKMLGVMLEHDFMIKTIISDTFVLTKLRNSGSDQMPLNTLGRVVNARWPAGVFVQLSQLICSETCSERFGTWFNFSTSCMNRFPRFLLLNGRLVKLYCVKN